jgi:hypothetical protein
MRIRTLVFGTAFMVMAGTHGWAAENFIVRGQPYSPGDDRLPPLGSPKDDLNLQTDLREAEIYVNQRQRKTFESDMSRFINNQELAEPDSTRLDY